MQKNSYTRPKVDFKKRRKSVAIPDQSMSIQEIVKRYVRGVPVDIHKREAVYVDQNDHDLEKMSRMDFGDKHSAAQAMELEAKNMQSDLERLAEQRKARAKGATAKPKPTEPETGSQDPPA